MVSPDGIVARGVAVMVIITGLLYYHFQYFYSVKATIFKNVKTSIEKIWSDKILPANMSYFSEDLSDTVKALDSFNTDVLPIIQNTVDLVGYNEKSCAARNEYFMIFLESVFVLVSVLLLITA